MADLWYYTQNGQPKDPVSNAELKRLAATGKLQPDDLVWKEGMPNWVKASTAKGLFDEAPAASSVTQARGSATRKVLDELPASPRRARNDDVDDDDEPRPRKRSRADDWDDDRPRRRREDDDDLGDDRPRRRRKKKQAGSGAVVGMVIGGLALVVVLIVLVGVVAFSGNSPPKMEDSRNWSLGIDGKATYHLRFLAGHRVEMHVRSNGPSDVDLFLYDDDDHPIMKDEGLSSDCHLQFVPAETRTYKVEVWNRRYEKAAEQGRDGPNSGVFTYRQVDLKQAANNPPPNNPNNLPPNDPPPQFPVNNPPPNNPGVGEIRYGGILARNGRKTYPVRMDAGVTYTIDLRSKTFDCFLELEDPTGQLVEDDDDSGGNLDSRIVFRAPQSGTYRLVVTALDNSGSGPYTLTIRR